MTSTFMSRMESLTDGFTARYCQESTLGWVREIWQSDRESDYTAFARTAAYVADELRRIGASEVEIVECPADGKTRMQAWTMPLAWEGGEAVLRIISPHKEVICDRSVQPLSCVMWSEPTPAGGVSGPLIAVEDPADLSADEREKLRGAFILTSRKGLELKAFAHEVGAAAIVSSFVPHSERHADTDAVGWSNAWADDPGGWAMKASDCRMTGFCISVPAAGRLHKLIAAGPVMCEATVGGRVGQGVLPVVTAVIPGQSDEEILLNGHLYEIGVIDNASGGAVMLEAMRLMASMPRPRRRVRVQFTSECYGTYAFYTLRDELLKRTLAGLNVDCVGEAQSKELPQMWRRTPEAAPSAVDTVLRTAMRLTETLPGCRQAEEGAHTLSDNIVCDPAAGVAMPIMMRAPWTWHTSLDDWSQIDPNSMRRAAVAATAHIRWLAEAGPTDADSLAEFAAAEAKAALDDLNGMTPAGRAFFADRARARVLWTERLGATGAVAAACDLPELDLASLVTAQDGGDAERGTIPVRSFWGNPTFDEISEADRQGLSDPRWDNLLLAATYWADGRRSVAEIAALVRTQFGESVPNLLKFFRVLQAGGLVQLKS